MDTINRTQELERLREESHVLEEKAGISQKMEDAHIHPWPFGRELTTEEYRRETEEWLHILTRDHYFSVKDAELRKKLIATKRKIDTTYQLLLEEDVMVAKHDVSVGYTKAWHQPWLKTGIYGLIVLMISNWIFGIKGSVLSIAFVIWFLTNERDEIKYELTQAFERLRDAEEAKAEKSNMTEVFSATEEQIGTEDIFEDESLTLLPYATGKLRK